MKQRCQSSAFEMEEVGLHSRHRIADEACQRWINFASHRAHLGTKSVIGTKYRDRLAVLARPLRLLLTFFAGGKRNQVDFVPIAEVANQICGYQAKPVMTRQTRDHLRDEQYLHPVRRRGIRITGFALSAPAAGTGFLLFSAACKAIVYRLGVSEMNTQTSFMYCAVRKNSATMMPISPT